MTNFTCQVFLSSCEFSGRFGFLFKNNIRIQSLITVTFSNVMQSALNFKNSMACYVHWYHPNCFGWVFRAAIFPFSQLSSNKRLLVYYEKPVNKCCKNKTKRTKKQNKSKKSQIWMEILNTSNLQSWTKYLECRLFFDTMLETLAELPSVNICWQNKLYWWEENRF